MVVEKISIDVWVKNNTKQGLDNIRDDLKWFNQRIKSDTAIVLSINVAKVKTKLDEVKRQIKEAQANEDFKLEIKLTAEQERLKQQLTQAKRELRNFTRTGEKDVSVLWKLFNNVTSEIEKTRLELIKAWKSTAWLDKISASLKKWEISAEQARISIWKLNASKFTWITSSLKKLWTQMLATFWIFQVINFWKDSVQQFAEFEKGLARVNTILRTTEKNIKTLWIDIQEISTTYWIAKDELVDTAFNIASAWVELENVNELLEISARTALWAWTDTTTAFNGIISVVKKYWLDLQESQSIADKFFKTNELWQTTVEDLAKWLTSLTSTAKLAWVWINDLFAVYSSLTWVTWNANEVTTQLNGAIKALSAPSTQASKLLKQLWIDTSKTAIEEKGLANVSRELWEATWKNLEVLRKIIPRQEANNLIVALATEQYWKYTKASEELANSQWSLKTAINEVTKTTAFQLSVAQEKWNNLKIWVWNALAIMWWYIADTIEIIKWLWKVFVIIWVQALNAIWHLIWWITLWLWDITKIVTTFAWNVWKIFWFLISNIWNAFNSLPALAQNWINNLLKWITDGVNKAIDLLNKLPKVNIWKVWWVELSFKWSQKSLQDLQKGFNSLSLKKLDTSFSWAKSSFDSFMKTWNKLNKWFTEWLNDIQNGFEWFNWKGTTSKKVLDDLVIKSQKFWDANTNTADNINEVNNALWWTSSQTNKVIDKEEELEKQRQENAEKENKRLEERQENLEDQYKAVWDVIDKEIEDIKKLIEEYDNQIDKLKESVEELNGQLADLETWRAETLWERNIEILEREKEIRKELKELKQEDFTTKSLENEKKLNEELKNLLEERRLIEKNATAEELDEAKRINELSPTAKFLEEFELKKVALEEERELKQQQIDDLQIQKDSETEILERFNEAKIRIDEQYAEKTALIEEQITNKVTIEADKRIKKLEELRQKALAAAEAMRKAWIVQKEVNASWNASSVTTNNRNVTTWDIIVNNDADLMQVQKYLSN